MIDKVKIEVTDKHVNNAYNSNYSPLDIATAEYLKVDVDRVEVKKDKIYVWMYDDSDYMLYTYDEESYVKIYDFLNEWELVTDGYTDKDGAVPFEGDLISFNIEVDNDTGTHSNHWHGASIDCSWDTDESDLHHRKNLKFRLTDDEY
jgi:hypothetical protein